MPNYRRINLYAGPGAGKTTSRAWLFSMMKMDQLDVEEAKEVVKAWAWMGRTPAGFDQVLLLGQQMQEEYIPLKGSHDKNGVVYVVTDCPLFLGACYAMKMQMPGWEHIVGLTQKFEEEYPSINIYLDRGDKPYKSEGRYQTAEQAKEMDRFVLEQLKKYEIPFTTVKYKDLDGLRETVYGMLDIPVPVASKEQRLTALREMIEACRDILPPEMKHLLKELDGEEAVEVPQPGPKDDFELLDFWATWCGPCLMLKPVLEAVGKARDDVKIKMMCVEEEEVAPLAEKFEVRSIPCMVLTKNGDEVDRLVGARSASEINAWLDEHLKK